MEHYDYHTSELWEDGAYGNGRTCPPKKRGGAIALLLVLVIFLLGITSLLGVLNIRLFRQLRAAREAESSITFSTQQNVAEAQPAETLPPETAPMSEAREEFRLDMEPAAQGADNLPREDALPLQDIYAQNIPSVVSISCQSYGGTSSGTGVIVSRDGYIVTNAHVVENAQLIQVLLTDGREFTARMVGTDETTDLAVLSIEAEDLQAARFGSSENLRVGDSVVAIGDPLGVELRGTMTDGIISAINRDVVVSGRTLSLIQTNAALNPGNSGGPLIDCYGRVIGINTMKIGDSVTSAGVEGLGFAIPSDLMCTVVDQLISLGYVSGRPTLGITGETLDIFYQHYYRMPEGLYLTGVDSSGPAGLAGVEVGDILISLNGTPITTPNELNAFLASCQVGDEVTIIIYRAGRQASATVTVAEATK